MADDLALRLMEFLKRFDEKHVEWGVDDCSAMCAAWARENGYDVQIPSYSSQEEAHALIKEGGGLIRLWERFCASAGVSERYGEPQLGDVGIIDTRRFGPIGVIWASGGICCWRVSKSAFWLAPRGYLKVWAIS